MSDLYHDLTRESIYRHDE